MSTSDPRSITEIVQQCSPAVQRTAVLAVEALEGDDDKLSAFQASCRPADFLELVRRTFDTQQSYTVHVAIIEHRHGTDILHASTAEKLDQKIVDYCRNNWELESAYWSELPEDPKEIVEGYFAQRQDDYMETVTLLSEDQLG